MIGFNVKGVGRGSGGNEGGAVCFGGALEGFLRLSASKSKRTNFVLGDSTVFFNEGVGSLVIGGE